MKNGGFAMKIGARSLLGKDSRLLHFWLANVPPGKHFTYPARGPVGSMEEKRVFGIVAMGYSKHEGTMKHRKQKKTVNPNCKSKNVKYASPSTVANPSIVPLLSDITDAHSLPPSHLSVLVVKIIIIPPPYSLTYSLIVIPRKHGCLQPEPRNLLKLIFLVIFFI